MRISQNEFARIRATLASIPGDVSNDAVGAYAPKLEDMFAPATHAAALDPTTPIVVGSRGAGKSFWSGVLGQSETKAAASKAYPGLGLSRVNVGFGFTGVGGPGGFGSDALENYLPGDIDLASAKTFWWATILRATSAFRERSVKFGDLMNVAADFEEREAILAIEEARFREAETNLLIVFDALDTVAISWNRRRILTQALFEVVWAMRAYKRIRLKLFLRPDQLDDDDLKFVELPKLRAGAVRLTWTGVDLYGLLFARLMTLDTGSFGTLLRELGIPRADSLDILSRRWPLSTNIDLQAEVMTALAGPFMADGPYGYKKGKTYDWPVTHLADSFDEVTPRSFLTLIIAASKAYSPSDRAFSADGIRQGLRSASRVRVDQLHLEFPWIKGVLAPMAGLLLPQNELIVYNTWRRAGTVRQVSLDAQLNSYLPPFPLDGKSKESALFEALARIGVMFRRKDDRLDMPDLFRVAAKLLKKGGTAPV